MSKNNAICVGVITGSYGVRGEARIKSFCAEPTAIADYAPLTTEDGKQSYSLSITRPVKGGFAVRLGGVTSREQADALKGTKLYTKRETLPDLPDDEYYYTDLIGLTALDTGGRILGRINDLQDHGAGDLLELVGPDLNGPVLVPFTREIVPTVDLKARRVIIDAPDGLIG
jgi:16S rRNA processing protein RimM